MDEERSPCLKCEREKKSKSKCVKSCEKIDRYREGQPAITLWNGEPTYYVIPGLERTRTYAAME
ncbi:MAG: hypothetical protein PVF76_16810 [Syntrophobacterales bacterium]